MHGRNIATRVNSISTVARDNLALGVSFQICDKIASQQALWEIICTVDGLRFTIHNSKCVLLGPKHNHADHLKVSWLFFAVPSLARCGNSGQFLELIHF